MLNLVSELALVPVLTLSKGPATRTPSITRCAARAIQLALVSVRAEPLARDKVRCIPLARHW